MRTSRFGFLGGRQGLRPGVRNGVWRRADERENEEATSQNFACFQGDSSLGSSQSWNLKGILFFWRHPVSRTAPKKNSISFHLRIGVPEWGVSRMSRLWTARWVTSSQL